MPKLEVSIIIPVFNSEQFLGESIQSAIREAVLIGKSEIIVVDNNSKDKSIEIAKTILGSSTVRHLIVNQEIQGASPTRNLGVSLANGHWIKFLDADDVIGEGSTLAQLQVAQNVPNNCGLIYSNWARGDKDLNLTALITPKIRTKSIEAAIDLLEASNFLAMGSSLICRDAFNAVGGFSDSVVIEDVELYIRLAEANCTFVGCETERPSLIYRDVQNSLSKQNDIAFSMAVRRNARMVLEFAAREGQMTREVVDSVSNRYFQTTRALFQKDRHKFREVLSEMKELNLNLLPQGPTHFRFLAQVFGYELAEEIAGIARGWISSLRVGLLSR